jgi:hypothetical protein
MGLLVHGVCDVTGICDAWMAIMLRPVVPYVEEFELYNGGLGNLQETNTVTQSTNLYC